MWAKKKKKIMCTNECVPSAELAQGFLFYVCLCLYKATSSVLLLSFLSTDEAGSKPGETS